jgi:hypothetical protein
LPPERLRWLSFGHLEADEMGAMNSWLAAAHACRASAITATTGPVVRSRAARTPHTLALMHGPAFTGDTAGALNAKEAA